MYKLLVTDVDGTLLDNQSKVPELNRQAIFACMGKGIKVILATGKTILSISHLIEMFGLKLPQITLNGGVIATNKNDILKSRAIREKDYIELLKTIREYGVSCTSALLDGRVLYETYHPNMRYITDSGVELIKVDSLDDPHIIQNTVSVHVPARETDPVDKYMRDKFGEKLFIVRSGEYFFDFLSKGLCKGNALKEIMHMLGYGREEVVVFGDSYNDLSMFEVAGLNIAVKNSYPEVLQKADIVTEENYRAGLGKAVFRHILKEY